MRATAPDWSDCVDHVAGGEIVATSDLRFTDSAAAERAALGEELRTRGAMNRAVYATTAEEGSIRGVDDGVDGELGDVTVDDFDHGMSGGVDSEIVSWKPLQPR